MKRKIRKMEKVKKFDYYQAWEKLRQLNEAKARICLCGMGR